MRALALCLLLACAEEAVGPIDAGSAADALPSEDAVAADAATRADAAAPSDAAPAEDAAPRPDGGLPPDAAAGDASASAPDAGAAARVHHVAPTGSDRATGTDADPLRTIGEGLRRAQAGEVVRVHAGRYAELASFPRSGAPGAPIVLEAASGERVILDGAGLGAGAGEPALVSIVDRSDVVVRGLELTGLTGAGGSFPAGIWVRGASSRVRIERNLVYGIRAENGGDGAGAHGIAIYGTSRTPSEDLEVLDNEVRELVLGWSEAVVVNGNVRRFLLRGNLVHDVNNIAFDVIGFEQDVCPSCSQADVVSDDVNRAREGRLVANTAYAMTTFGNPAYGNERSAACFYVDGGADIVIERNVAHGCDLGVELASEHAGRSTARVIVRSNFLYANAVTGVATGGYDPGNGAGGGSAEDCAIVHNTIVDSSRDGWAETGILLQNRNHNNRYLNNVVIASAGSAAMSAVGADNTGNVFDGNFSFGGAVEGIREGSGSRRVDPRLVSASDLHLAAGSPARGAAVALDLALAGAEDIDGQPRAQGARDVGADEVP